MKRLFHLVVVGIFSIYSCSDQTEAWKDPRNERDYTAVGEYLHGEFVDNFTYKLYPKNNDNFDNATFRLWIPDDVNDLKAILVLLPVHNGSGIDLFKDEAWRTLAKKESMALISVSLYTSREKVGYINAGNGSGRALNEAIEKLGEMNNLATLSTLNYVMRGYEVGAAFCISFSEYFPEKVAMIGSIRGASTGNEITENLKIPTLMVVAENDFRMVYNRDAVLSKRASGGLWALAIEPNQDQYGSLIPSDNLIRSFFTSTLAKRINSDTKQLLPIMESTGWLGDNETYNYFPFNEFHEDPAIASWLIDKEFAIAWQKFQNE